MEPLATKFADAEKVPRFVSPGSKLAAQVKADRRKGAQSVSWQAAAD